MGCSLSLLKSVSYCGPFSSWHCNVHSSWGTVLYFSVHHGWTAASHLRIKVLALVQAFTADITQFLSQTTSHLPSDISLSGLPYNALSRYNLASSRSFWTLTTIVACFSSWTTCWFPISVSYLVQRVHNSSVLWIVCSHLNPMDNVF